MQADVHIPPHAGEAVALAPGLRRVLAPNPSPMTYWGTNTYIVGQGEVAVIDPGPDRPEHLTALLAALEPGETVGAIIVSHAHADHSPLARSLAAVTGAKVLAFGAADAGRSALMRALAAGAVTDGGEGVDAGFVPDICLVDGEAINGAGWQLQVLHTPGHFSNHISLIWGNAVFTGDHVMGWASSLVSPPDGDMGAYMASLERLRDVDAFVYYPGHGAPVHDPVVRLSELTAHRKMREAQIISALARGSADAATLARAIYIDTPAALIGAATRNVHAHLLDLWQRGEAKCDSSPGTQALFRIG